MGLLKSNKRLFGEIISDVKSQTNVNLMTLDPILDRLYSNKASRFFNRSFSVLSEYLLYALGVAFIVFAFFMQLVFPFHLMSDLMGIPQYAEMLGKNDLSLFTLAIRGLSALVGILFLLLGLNVRSGRSFKQNIQESANELKLIQENLKRNIEDLDLIEYHSLDETRPLPPDNLVDDIPL